MNTFPLIETPNYILRKFIEEDYYDYYKYVSDEKIKKQFLFDYNEVTCKERFNYLLSRFNSDNPPLVWVITLKSNNKLIGIISIDSISKANKKCSLACGILEEYRNNGIAFEVTKELINYIFNNFDINRIELAHNVDNISSQKVIEKLGSIYEGVARESKYYNNSFIDRKIYSILKKEWNNSEN